jgi:hypothetical protein
MTDFSFIKPLAIVPNTTKIERRKTKEIKKIVEIFQHFAFVV